MWKYVYDTAMQYGVDITSTRLDDLDKRVFSEIQKKALQGESVTVLDGGCGKGGLAVSLSRVGAKVTALDIDNYANEIKERVAGATLPPPSLTFVQNNIASFLFKSDEIFDMVVLQRVLHYLPYTLARQVLSTLLIKADTLYLSVTGANTAIAKHYPVLKKPIEKRWGKLDIQGQKLFSITAPLCLYSEKEIFNLLTETGWSIDWSRVSDFGNIKVVARSV